MPDEKKVEEALVDSESLRGLIALRELDLLWGKDPVELCTSWPKARVGLDSEGRVVVLDLGGRRLQRGLPDPDVFHRFTKLTVLNLGGTNVPVDNLRAILAACPNTLACLHLGRNGLGGSGASMLAECLPKSVVKLDLRYSDLDDPSLVALQPKLGQLECLHLEGNQLSTLEALAQVLSDPLSCLQQVYLGANRITDDGARHLATSLSSNQRLLQLCLEGNQIGLQGAEALIDLLESGQSVLQYIYVDNNNIGRDGSRRLTRALNRRAT